MEKPCSNHLAWDPCGLRSGWTCHSQNQGHRTSPHSDIKQPSENLQPPIVAHNGLFAAPDAKTLSDCRRVAHRGLSHGCLLRSLACECFLKMIPEPHTALRAQFGKTP